MESTVVKIVENRGLWCVKWQRWVKWQLGNYMKIIIRASFMTEFGILQTTPKQGRLRMHYDSKRTALPSLVKDI